MPAKKASAKKGGAKRKAPPAAEEPAAKRVKMLSAAAKDRLPQAAEAAGKLAAFLQERETKNSKNVLMPEAEKVFASVQFMQSMPKGTSRARRAVAIPHGIYNREDVEVCLITTSPQRMWKDKLAAAGGNANVKKVIDINKLRKKFKSYEQKRELATGFGLFVADEAVLNFLPKILGKTFFSRSKEPITVDMKKFPASLDAALSSTSYSLRDNACVSVCLGMSDFEASDLAANCHAVVDDIVKQCPNGWRDIHSIALRSSDSPALPIYAHQFTESRDAPIAQNEFPERHVLEVPELTVPKRSKKEIAAEVAAEEEERREAAAKQAEADEEDALSDLSDISLDNDDEEDEEDEQ